VLRIVIHDDGGGIDSTSFRPGSRGLQSMQQRIKELGGRLKRSGQYGTTYCLRIPMPLQHSAKPPATNDICAR
jgi:signal transduction histidine kinase